MRAPNARKEINPAFVSSVYVRSDVSAGKKFSQNSERLLKSADEVDGVHIANIILVRTLRLRDRNLCNGSHEMSLTLITFNFDFFTFCQECI